MIQIHRYPAEESYPLPGDFLQPQACLTIQKPEAIHLIAI